MKKFPKFLSAIFSTKELQGLDVEEIMAALSDPTVRKIWVMDLFGEMQQLNLEVDKRLLTDETNIKDLAIRRRTYQDLFEKVLIAKRRAYTPNPQSSGFDLDSVTVEPV